MSSASEVPANNSAASGSVEASFNKETNTLSWKVVYSGLSGPAAAGHFHGPAGPGQNAGVALRFKASVDSPIVGEAVLAATQMAADTHIAEGASLGNRRQISEGAARCQGHCSASQRASSIEPGSNPAGASRPL